MRANVEWDVFLSYSSKDLKFAQILARDLKEAGCYFDLPQLSKVGVGLE